MASLKLSHHCFLRRYESICYPVRVTSNAALQPILHENYAFMRQKICLMALIESVFKRGAYDRTLSYQTISEETHLPLDEVEHLVMKGLR